MNLSYSYAGGFGAGVNVGGGGLGAGVSYNEKSGFGVSAGIMGNGVSLMYTENFGKGDVRASHGWQAQVGGLEVNYDNLSGYSASFQAASAMFGNLKISTALTWSEQNGFNGSASYNFLSKEQMAKEAAKGAQKNQGNLFLNIMDGLGYNLGGREGEPTLLDNITGAFSGAWNTVKGAGNWIGNKASSAWDGITGLFGGKKPQQVVMMPAMGTDYNESLTIFDPSKNEGAPPTGWVEGDDGKFYHPNSEEAWNIGMRQAGFDGVELVVDKKTKLMNQVKTALAYHQMLQEGADLNDDQMAYYRNTLRSLNAQGIEVDGFLLNKPIEVTGKNPTGENRVKGIASALDALNIPQGIKSEIMDDAIRAAVENGDDVSGLKGYSAGMKVFGAVGNAASVVSTLVDVQNRGYWKNSEIFDAGLSGTTLGLVVTAMFLPTVPLLTVAAGMFSVFGLAYAGASLIYKYNNSKGKTLSEMLFDRKEY
ncbi:hypothetical protein [Leptospira gomenensis]|uniref:hypothetical protein n=2 Tax=Leptospira gomenensis TaxID=2484974 RepID=UPI001FE44408|nr:hypothetical protein [Leptospira gomenensis]